MRGLLLYNPHATTTNARVRDAVTTALAERFDLQVQPTKARGHASHIAAGAVHEGIEVVFALGGDGTANEVVQGLAGTEVAFAHVPGGGTNIVARSFGLPNDPVATCQELCEAADLEPRLIGLGRAGARWFACTAGLGFDAAIVRRVEQRPHMKRWLRQLSFVWSGFAEWFEGTAGVPAETMVELPGGAMHGPHAITLIGNSDPYTFLGPRPLRITPLATFETGLDLLSVEAVSTRRLLATLARAFGSGSHIRQPHVEYFHDLAHFTLRSEHPQPLMVDGDYAGDFREVTFRSVPNALRVLAGPSWLREGATKAS